MSNSPYYPSNVKPGARKSSARSAPTAVRSGNSRTVSAAAFAAPRTGARRIVTALSGVLAAVIFMAAGYFIANKANVPPSLFHFGEPVAVASLTPVQAFQEIHTLYPNALITVTTYQAGEIDLITQPLRSSKSVTQLSAQIQTQILELYMRAYPNQHFWQWYDTNGMTKTLFQVFYESLWVTTMDTSTCNTQWNIYAITPPQIISNGVSGKPYFQGLTAQQSNNPEPSSPYLVCQSQ